MPKTLKLKSKRLIVTPMSDEEMKTLISNTADPELKTAYSQMLDGSINNAKNRLWYAAWKITTKDTGKSVGNACFMGAPVDGMVEIGYGIDDEYRGNGYATEALKLLTEYAFSNNEVYFISAETDAENDASRRVLEKTKFSQCMNGKEGPRFVLEKPASAWMSIYMCLGMSLGVSFGLMLDKIPYGLCFGIPIGLLIGTYLDKEDKKKRNMLKEKHEEFKNA